jgi:hypothetical protein
MFKWKAKLVQPRLDLSKYRDALSKQLRETIGEAAFQWADAALAEIPTWSGASRATFLHLTREIGFPNVITPVVASRVPLGLSSSEGGIKIESSGDGKVYFFYSTTLDHLIYNEYTNANLFPDPTLLSQLKNPGPYHFQEKAEVAFRRAAGDTILPDPKRFISTKQTIRVS